jgi:hypothetical protein
MNYPTFKIILFLAILVITCACNTIPQNTGYSTTSVTAQSVPIENSMLNSQNNDEPVDFFNDDVHYEETLAYNGYRVEKNTKIARIKYDDGEIQTMPTTVVTLKRDNKIIETFEGVHYPSGNDAYFILSPILGRQTKQLIIGEEANRDNRYWIVELSQKVEVLFDSGDYDVGRYFRKIDINHDGKYEVVQLLTAFWFFDEFNNINSPFIDIIFAYDEERKKYLPANPQFQKFALRTLAQDIAKARNTKSDGNTLRPGRDKLGAVMKVVLSYLYAGKEKEGWAFYESEYKLPDKEEMRTKFQERLSRDAIYKVVRK